MGPEAHGSGDAVTVTTTVPRTVAGTPGGWEVYLTPNSAPSAAPLHGSLTSSLEARRLLGPGDRAGSTLGAVRVSPTTAQRAPQQVSENGPFGTLGRKANSKIVRIGDPRLA